MTMPSTDPALEFFLRFVEFEGALVDSYGDHALAVIPPEVCSALEAPDEIMLTADPEVARDGDAALLVPGHPLLDAAVSRVLEQGDAGRVWIQWPTSAPDSSTLLERIRARFPVDHGRVDPADEVVASYTPILRVGALVTYALSIDQRFQEQAEAWIDGCTGLEADEATVAAVRRRAWVLEPGNDHPVERFDLRSALGAGWQALEERVGWRLESLVEQGRDEMLAERGRAEAYYAANLASLERRRAAAPQERVALLDARMAATRAERDRRLAEIEETHRPTFQMKPFRVHLVAVPSLAIPLVVRRGERAYPFRARWLLGAGALAPERCPGCSSTEALVAGRERLGCVACLPRPAASIPPRVDPAPAPLVARAQSGAIEVRPPGTGRDNDALAGGRVREKPKAPGRAGARSAGTHLSGRNDGRIVKEGSKLATRFWNTAATGERWPNKLIAPESPARAMRRLFGAGAPFVAVGIPLDEMILRWTAATAVPYRDLPEVTTGTVLTEGGAYPYTLRWRMQEGRALLLEILPYPRVVDGCLPPDSSLPPSAGRRLFVEVPHPRLPLDGVAKQLWDQFLPVVGLPIVARCVAAYWRLPVAPSASNDLVAEALVRVITTRSRRGANQTLSEVDDVGPVVDELHRALKLSAACPW